jgi:hypothetical protein
MGSMSKTSDVIVRLGGPGKVAEALGMQPNAVSMWGVRGSVPWRWRASVRQLFKDFDKPLPKWADRELSLTSRKNGRRNGG